MLCIVDLCKKRFLEVVFIWNYYGGRFERKYQNIYIYRCGISVAVHRLAVSPAQYALYSHRPSQTLHRLRSLYAPYGYLDVLAEKPHHAEEYAHVPAVWEHGIDILADRAAASGGFFL